MAIVTLLTDFSVQDEYVGVLKGVILSTDPSAEIVDICHGIAPQDVLQAAHMLEAAYPFFPEDTVHVAVVDPGVGTQRSIIAARACGHRFIAPDNGLLEPILRGCDKPVIHRVENENLFRRPVSNTFHGRDIIAPVAAHLSAGILLERVGPYVEMTDIQVVKNVNAEWISPHVLEGRVINVDRFGNLVTNIRAEDLERIGEAEPLIVVGNAKISGFRQAYAQGVHGEPMAIWSSRNTLEIAVKEGNAARLLRLKKGAVVRVSTDRE